MPLLIIDDFGMRNLPTPPPGRICWKSSCAATNASALCSLPNRPVEDWGQPSRRCRRRQRHMLDRLLHHGYVLKCGARRKPLAHEKRQPSIMRKKLYSLRGPAPRAPRIYRSLARMTFETAGDDVLEGIKMWFSTPNLLIRKTRTAAVERELRTATGDSERLLLTPVGENLFRVEGELVHYRCGL